MKINDVLRGKGNQVVTISPEATVTELLALLAEHNIGAVVVSPDGSSVAGIVSERDVVRLWNGTPDAGEVRVSSIMTAEVATCGPDDHIDNLMRLMTDRRIRHVPVVVDGALTGTGQHRRRGQVPDRRARVRARTTVQLHQQLIHPAVARRGLQSVHGTDTTHGRELRYAAVRAASARRPTAAAGPTARAAAGPAGTRATRSRTGGSPDSRVPGTAASRTANRRTKVSRPTRASRSSRASSTKASSTRASRRTPGAACRTGCRGRSTPARSSRRRPACRPSCRSCSGCWAAS